jgi:hypothetical protein
MLRERWGSSLSSDFTSSSLRAKPSVPRVHFVHIIRHAKRGTDIDSLLEIDTDPLVGGRNLAFLRNLGAISGEG